MELIYLYSINQSVWMVLHIFWTSTPVKSWHFLSLIRKLFAYYILNEFHLFFFLLRFQLIKSVYESIDREEAYEITFIIYVVIGSVVGVFLIAGFCISYCTKQNKGKIYPWLLSKIRWGLYRRHRIRIRYFGRKVRRKKGGRI